MANAGFNGSTISFASEVTTPLRDIDYSEEAAKVDIRGAADSNKTYMAGVPDRTVTFTVVGATATVPGDVGAVAIAWFDGGTSAIAAAICTGVTINGSLDGEITSQITVVPS